MIGWVLMARKAVNWSLAPGPFKRGGCGCWLCKKYWRLFDKAERLGVTVRGNPDGV